MAHFKMAHFETAFANFIRIDTCPAASTRCVNSALLGHLLAMSAGLGKTPIQPTQPYNVDLCWQVTYSCASKLHNFTNRLGRFLVS
jgi:hypothetical protein